MPSGRWGYHNATRQGTGLRDAPTLLNRYLSKASDVSACLSLNIVDLCVGLLESLMSYQHRFEMVNHYRDGG